jgi:transposase InsO family protein
MASGKSYGSRRVRKALAQRGVPMGRFCVRRLMRENGLRPVWKRKFINTTDSKHDYPVAPNLLDRQFNVAQPNTVYAAA